MDQLSDSNLSKHRAASSASDISSGSSSSLRSKSNCSSKTSPLTFTHIMGQGRINQLGGIFINGRPLPQHIRMKIIELASKGIKPCHISRQLRVSHGCVSKILYRYAETGTVVPGQIGGASKQNRKMMENLEQKVLEIHRKNPNISVTQIRILLIEEGLCNQTTAPSIHSIAKLIKFSQKSRKKSLKHSISYILGEHSDDNEVKIMDDSLSITLNNNANQPANRRCRTWFSPEQLECLERVFRANTYPNSQQREQISAETGLSESKIQVWFSNRRARYRKSVSSANFEQWNSAIRNSNFDLQMTGLQTQTPPPQIPSISPMDIINASQQTKATVERIQPNPLFPAVSQVALVQQANPVQLLTSLMFFARPEYLQLLQHQRQSN